MIARALLWLALLAGCPREDDEAPVPRAASDEGTGPLDALSRRFGRLRARLRERGYGEATSLRRVFVLEGEALAFPLDLSSRRCTTIVALGGGGLRDLDLRLFDGEGEQVGADADRGEGTLVYACPPVAAGTNAPATAPHYAVLEAKEGSAAVVLGELESERGEGSGFDGLFEGVLSPSVPFRDVEAELARSRSALRARGLEPLLDVEVQAFAESEVARHNVPLETGACYSILVRSGEGVVDVDVMVTSPNGVEVARNLNRDAEPSLTFCPEESGEHAVEMRLVEGAGAIGMLVARGDERPAREDPIPPEGPSEVRHAADLGLPAPAASVMLVARGLESRGYETPRLLVPEATIGPGELRSHGLPLEPGCAVVLGASPDEATDLDLYLLDGENRVLSRDTGVQAVARVSVCVSEREIVRVMVKSYGEHAEYALAVLRAPRAISDLRELRLEEATASLRARGFAPVEQLERSLEEGERSTIDLEVPPQRCVAVAAAGDVSVEDVDVFLRTPAGDLVASESGPAPYASVMRCAGDEAESLVAEVVMYRGSGAVLVAELEDTP